MYTILFAEDEKIIRDGVQKLINFEQLGFKLVKICSDGKEAIDYIKNNSVDIIITDIQMPKASGLEIAKFVKDSQLNTKVVILTGYNEFDFAKKAIEYQVFDYILKPVTKKKFSELLEKLKYTLDQLNVQKTQMNAMETEIHKSKEHNRHNILNKILTSNLHSIKINNLFSSIGFNITSEKFVLILIKAKNFATENLSQSDFNYAIENIINEIFQTKNITTTILNNQIVVIINEAVSEEEIKEACSTITELSLNYLKETLIFSVSEIFSDLSNISSIYYSTLKSFNYSYLVDTVITPQTTQQENLSEFIKNEFTQNIISALKTMDINKAQNILKEMLVSAKANYVNRAFLTQQLLNLYLMICEMSGKTFDNTIQIDIEQNKCLDFFNTLFLEYKACTQENKDIYINSQVEEAKEFIKDNISNSDLGLEDVCKKLCVSMSYFNNIFKQKEGKTFIEYLTNLRIQKAKELLKTTDKKSYEVGLECGYADSHYFSVIFKKHTGVSPKAFRDL